jgi:PAS domain S-box-containing protein
VPSGDADDARRRKLLNIILMGTGTLCALMLGYTIYLLFTMPRTEWIRDVSNVSWASLCLLMTSILLFILNRKVRGWLASGLFLLIITVAISFTDSPEELLAGRSLFFLTLPIILAGILMPSGGTFVAMGLSDLILVFLAARIPDGWTHIPTPLVSFAFIALLAWLSSRSVETALRDLREININLDRLVQERTKELASALARERIESGRSKAILESIADGVIVFDLQGFAIIANPSSVSLLDIPYEQIMGSSIDDLTQAKALDARNRGLLAGLLSSPGQQLTSYHIQWGRKTLSVTAARVNDIEGTPLGIVAVFRDYTREAEVERMKNTFLAIVSHELRTPLNAILGYAEMLKEAVYGPVNEKQVRASERIMTNSRRLLDIVSDLLDQAQMEAGKLTIHLRAFRPSDLVDNVQGVMDKIAADKGLTLTGQLDPTLPEFINGDMARLQQILVNLINNAVKFTDKGSITMNIYRADRRCWKLEVTDTGIGIPEDELPNIFEAFRQVDSSATRKHGGFGLGLTIVKQLSELMGGEVLVKSVVGVGSTFTVTLPLIPARRRIDERIGNGN